MHRLIRHAFGFVAFAAVLFSLSTGTAAAITGMWTRPGGLISIRGRIRADYFPAFACNLTLNGSFQSRLVSVTGEGAQFGNVSGMTASECTNLEEGIAEYRISEVLNFPWMVTLQKFNGVNPRFPSVIGLTELTWRIRGISFRISSSFPGFFPPCLFGGSSEILDVRQSLRLIRGFEYSLSPGSPVSFSFAGASPECERVASSLHGTFTLEVPSPVQTLAVLPSGEVSEALAPNPVEFGVLPPLGLSQRSVVISSTRGGRVEGLAVTTGRYFAVTDPNGCRGTTLAEGGRCTVNVIVSAPAEAGAIASDTLNVTVGTTRMTATLRAAT